MKKITCLFVATILVSLSTAAIADQELIEPQVLTEAQMDTVTGGLLFWPSSDTYGVGSTWSLADYYDNLWTSMGYPNPYGYYQNIGQTPGHISFFGGNYWYP